MMRYLAVFMLLPAVAFADFTYNPPGQLVPGSGTGRADDTVYVPDMRFPIEVAPAYPNSQVWGRGGLNGGGGGQCDAQNYSYPWWDNYCESRSWTMPLCPSGTGHQGQDIRPSTCAKDTHWVVAGEAGQVSDIGSYVVYVTSDTGTLHRYMHMNMNQLAVSRGQRVNKGDRLGLVSNHFGGTATTIHLHWDIGQNIPSAGGQVFVPTYMSLVRSYETLLGVEAEPCEIIGADGGTLDDFGPCATFYGNSQFWRIVDTGGHDNRFHWTNGFDSVTPSNWARYSFHFAEAGKYRLEFNVVSGFNVAKNVRYTVRVAGDERSFEIDQSTITDWHSLGEFDFAEGGDQWVAVHDNNGTTLDDQHITVDAFRLTRVRPTEPGTNNGNTTGPTETNSNTTEPTPTTNGTTGPTPTTNGTTGTNNETTGFDANDIRVSSGCCATTPRSDASAWALLLSGAAAMLVWRRRR